MALDRFKAVSPKVDFPVNQDTQGVIKSASLTSNDSYLLTVVSACGKYQGIYNVNLDSEYREINSDNVAKILQMDIAFIDDITTEEIEEAAEQGLELNNGIVVFKDGDMHCMLENFDFAGIELVVKATASQNGYTNLKLTNKKVAPAAAPKSVKKSRN